MRNTVIVLLLATFTAQASAPLTVEFRCFSTLTKPVIQLEWRIFTEPESKWTSGYVKYKGSSKLINIAYRDTEILDRPVGRPWEFSTTWVEIVDGRISGEYVVQSQGANIYNFTYKSNRSARKYSFVENNAAYTEAACNWD